MPTLFDSYTLSGLPLRNRAVMAPMTRARNPDAVPNDLTAQYYRQRAGAGLIVTEGVPVSEIANGNLYVPGLYTDAQVEGWTKVTQAVHAEGGAIFAQLWHVGRASHQNLLMGRKPHSSTARTAQTKVFAYDLNGKPGFVPATEPHAMTTEEVRETAFDFGKAAHRAIKAGFDGVEIHGANGYLLEQFLNPLVNDRTDQYGAQNLDDRVRFVLEVVDSVVAATAAGKVGIRLSPWGRFNDMPDYAQIEDTYLHLIRKLAERELAYVHLMDQSNGQGRPDVDGQNAAFLAKVREAFPKGAIIHAGAMTLESGNDLLQQGLVDLVGFVVRLISALLKEKAIKDRVVPIVPDEARTFGLEGMFRQLGIYAAHGQKYTPEDQEQLMHYREAKDGHMLQEGINEAGAMSAWAALATSYSTNNLPMIPMYMYYSMFGFQRIGDIAWAAGDAQAQGFLLGATAGRTTLNGEGLQHQDGHSHILANTIPNCVSYDPCFGYELAVIVHDGLQRMYVNQERVFYYLTVMNENYEHPEMLQGAEEGIKRGMYLLQEDEKATVQLMGSGVILREVIKAAQILRDEYQIHSNVFSVTSFNELARDGMACEEYNRLHPMAETAKEAWISQQLRGTSGIVVSATDHMRAYSEQIRAYLPDNRPFVALGTDGYGRSDTRANLRSYFGVDAAHIVVATLKKLADEGEVDARLVKDAISSFELDTDRPVAWLPQAHPELHAVADYKEEN